MISSNIIYTFLSPKKFGYHELLLFYLSKVEKELLSGVPPLYQNKLQEQGIQDVVKIKIYFEAYFDLVRPILILMKP